MQLPPLFDGRILRRYKRFLADVELADGACVTAHVPNTGSMATCWEPGAPVQVSYSDNARRKLAWTLERVQMGAGWVGVHTGRTNPVIAEAIAGERVTRLLGYGRLQREVSYAPAGQQRGRIDLLLSAGSGADALVEVKNVTLLDGEHVRFPDSVSLRGRKHLDLLRTAVEEGYRGVILFAVNRPEGNCFAPAWGIDPAYAERLLDVVEAGVEALAVRIRHAADGMEAGECLPLYLDRPG